MLPQPEPLVLKLAGSGQAARVTSEPTPAAALTRLRRASLESVPPQFCGAFLPQSGTPPVSLNPACRAKQGSERPESIGTLIVSRPPRKPIDALTITKDDGRPDQKRWLIK